MTDFLSEIMERVRAENHEPRDLGDLSFTCAQCGETHAGLFDLACEAPAPYLEAGEEERARDFELSDDLCIWTGEYHFVRCVLPIPVHGLDDWFGYGVWSSLSAANFALYREHWEHPAADGLGPWFGWFSNSLKGYPDTRNLKCRVHPRDGGQRPLIELEPTDHPLSLEQRHGISVERLMEIYAVNGHGAG